MNNCSSFRNFILTLLIVAASTLIPVKETRPGDVPEVIITPIGEIGEDILKPFRYGLQRLQFLYAMKGLLAK